MAEGFIRKSEDGAAHIYFIIEKWWDPRSTNVCTRCIAVIRNTAKSSSSAMNIRWSHTIVWFDKRQIVELDAYDLKRPIDEFVGMMPFAPTQTTCTASYTMERNNLYYQRSRNWGWWNF